MEDDRELVAPASCGFVQASENLLVHSPDGKAKAIEGLITGIGFIGGGAILKQGNSVHGTATAASLWATGGDRSFSWARQLRRGDSGRLVQDRPVPRGRRLAADDSTMPGSLYGFAASPRQRSGAPQLDPSRIV